VSRGEKQKPPATGQAERLLSGHSEKFQKKLKFPLDKLYKVCYNLNVIKRSHLLKSRKELILWLMLM